ncbi:MAG: ATP-dependent DNA helicase [Candidatus Parcubacteria bacterium]|nr:ATP-dependent DNA helicase [Candidatus Parcubacteria bacterium]
MPKEDLFTEEYKKLNKAQKDAVDSIEGPVMVVAGPGTGKTQILALRIGNILSKTDTKADGILCLTFTNSAVKAMRERLRKYIGAEASKVQVSTFHGFGMEMLEKYFSVLGLDEKPTLMDEKDTISLYDEVLQNNDWEFLRPRSDNSRYFKDLKSLISFLKRENISVEKFETEIKDEIKNIEEDPASLSSRGERKGKLKKEVESKIEGLNRTLEAVIFYEKYEKVKKEKNLFDYDDILKSLVNIVEESDEAKDFIKENFLYVLVDEHQDSSGVQNEFLQKVWGDEEKPNIFVVGDDRQLIYGFGGASLEYFENFKHTFGKAKLITLTDNYRSTQKILDSAHTLLESVLTKEKLKSNHKENHVLRLVEAYYPRDEIIYLGLEIKEKIKKGHDVNDMVILVPKNRQVESAVKILKDMDIPVAGGENLNLFDAEEAISFLRVLKILANPNDGSLLATSFFDSLSGISPLKAHQFLKGNYMREFSLLNVQEEKNNLFDGNEVNVWLQKLKSWLNDSNTSLYSFIQKVGTEFLLDNAKNHEELVVRIEVLRTVLHLVLSQIDKNPKINLVNLVSFLERIENYGEHIPLAIFAPDEGVKVLTLHGSKGLEFDYVWIAHMDEKSFAGGRTGGFTLPEVLKEKMEVKDELVLKRQLYVALTRAKRFCTISYALKSYTGASQELANTVADFADNFEKQTADETEKIILKTDNKAFVEKKQKEEKHIDLKDLVKLVARDYEGRKVSVSLLNNFFECPWKWYFRNLLQLPEPKSESLEFGNIVHGSIDAILKSAKIPSEKDLENIVIFQVKKSGFGDERKQKELTHLALIIVSKWTKNRLGEISKNRENEQSVSVSDDRFPVLNVYGKIDLIETLPARNASGIADAGGNDKEVRVTDFKTGGIRKKSEIEKLDEEGRMSSYLRQLAMYSYLLEQSPKWQAIVRESRLEFLEAKDDRESIYDRAVSNKEINLLVKDITDYDEMVKDGKWVNRPCNYNSYGKNTECEYCKMADIYKTKKE